MAISKKRSRDSTKGGNAVAQEFDNKLDINGAEELSDGDNDHLSSDDEEPAEFPEINPDSDEDAGDSDDDANSDNDSIHSSDSDTSLASFSSVPSTSSNVSDFIEKASKKPDETDYYSQPPKQKLGFEATARTVRSDATGEDKTVYRNIEPGYDSDSDTEEQQNAIGDVPAEWYEDMPHIGYDINGKKILKPATKDELERFLEHTEGDADTVPSKNMQQDMKLTPDELRLIRRLEKGQVPDDAFDPYPDQVEFFTGKGKEMVTPISGAPEPKRRFLPSKWEHEKIMKIARAIRAGRIVPNKPKAPPKPTFYAIWSNTDEHTPHVMDAPAPQEPPPKTIESFNPPPEYLFNEQERKEWEETDEQDRKIKFMPQKYSNLRLVPAYANLLKERFDRCLDLYLAPRVRRTKLNIDPESLVPKLPSPRELKPFPIYNAISYTHNARVRSISVDPTGIWLASAADDGYVRVWELSVGRCAYSWNIGEGEPVHSVEWCPDKEVSLLVATSEKQVTVLSPLPILTSGLSKASAQRADFAFANPQAGATKTADIRYARPNESQRENGLLVKIEVPGTPKQVVWHRKGDYFATVAGDAGSKSVLIHQLSKHQSQAPFKRSKGSVQKVQFHPTRPQFLLVTQRYVKLYDLVQQTLLKTFLPGLRWLSSIDVHPSGDNLIVGSYDRKVCWFDIDLGDKPYKTIRYHNRAVRAVKYHPSLPLFASSSDDGSVQVFHGRVFDDLATNALIVPLKVLKCHTLANGLGVLDLHWHPTQPFLFSAGADGLVNLYSH
ncbi:hypothetical protein E3P81_00874 [Wallemia ichthyophaga]|nr:hypothetical protein E3P97_00875 [Wallemia ichthyophaga]TIB34781.1 hypothetical protein E3P85_00729 [Wallemia ichthyophaga]TIB49360.1 hypothetical protein E3P82_00872 [Wallemia ichthyophaga]TIB53256.1 hypothetical protein E3P81_00874 [Wallemia ichthyophaga]TIB55883.1 hypothetical protein E3P80_00873 [Wallemia ichthyophaga]